MQLHMIPGTGFSSNVFLLEGEEKCLLIDSGLFETSNYVLSAISSILEGKKLESIFLTHRHCDHIGGAYPLSQKTGARILAPSGEADAIYRGDETTGASMFGVRVEPVEVEVVEPGTEISLEDMKLEVMHTPGHTSGSVVLFCREEKMLFSGDTVFAHGGVGRWDLPTGNLSDLTASLKGLCVLDMDSMYPGHGPPVEENASDSIAASLSSLGMW